MTDETQPATDTDVSVDVPAQHLTLVQRMLAALKRDEQWIVDNIHAGLQNLENMFKSDSNDASAGDNPVPTQAASTSAAQGQQAPQ